MTPRLPLASVPYALTVADNAVTTAKNAAGAITNAKISGIAYGKLTGAPTSLPPSGTAGGDLTGTYPNPTIGTGVVDCSNLASDAASLLKVSGGTMTSSSSKIGVGTATPGFPLTFQDVLGDKISLWGQSGDHYGFGVQDCLFQICSGGSGADIAFGYGSSAESTETARIKGNGHMGIGVPSASITHRLQLPKTASEYGKVQANGWVTYSSARWKTNVHPIEDALSKVEKLRGVYYDWKPVQGGKHDIGFVAEEVAKVLPEVVSMDSDGKNVSGMDYSRVDALLVEAIKEQQKAITRQQDEIDAFKKIVTDLAEGK